MEPIDPELTEQLSAAAVIAIGASGVVLVANRDASELPAAQPEPVVVPLTTLPPSDTDSPAGDTPVETTVTDDLRPHAATLQNDGEAPVEVDQYLGGSPYEYDPNAPDPAEPYLEQTTEIYRWETPSGHDIQVRRSNESYGELFGIEWDLPIGTAVDCLGGDAVFIGSPEGPVQRLSRWSVRQWRPVDTAQEISIEEHYTENASNLILRTALPATDVAIMQGTEVHDRADVVDAETAWFDYTIDAPTGTFGPRFGRALFSDEVW